MNSSHSKVLISVLILLGASAVAFAADDKAKAADKSKSDLLPPDKRKPSVEIAQHITQKPQPAPLPAELPQPFNPPGFDLPDRSEQPPITNSGTEGGTTVTGGGRGAAPGTPAPLPTDRELLDNIAANLPARATIMFRGEQLLSFGTKNVRVGQDITFRYNGQDYVVTLAALDSTTFTLRFRGLEVIRPIKPGK